MSDPRDTLTNRMQALADLHRLEGDHIEANLCDEAAAEITRLRGINSALVGKANALTIQSARDAEEITRLRAALSAQGAQPVAWMDPENPRDPIGAEKKLDLETINGSPGRTLAAKYTIPLIAAAAVPADGLRTAARLACEATADQLPLALDALRDHLAADTQRQGPNVEFSGVPAGHSSNHLAGGTSAGTQG